MRAPVALALVVASSLLVAATCRQEAAAQGAAAELARLETMAASRGDEAPPELGYDLALAALAVGRTEVAEAAAERMAVYGGPVWYGRRDFLLGNASWIESVRAERLSDRPEGGVPELDAALTHARSARDHWRRAAVRDGGNRAALRNVERALHRLEGLRGKRARLTGSTKREMNEDGPLSGEDVPGGEDAADDGTEAPPGPENVITEAPGDSAMDAAPEAITHELSPRQVAGLAGRLDAKRAEKRRLRREALRDRARGGGDW